MAAERVGAAKRRRDRQLRAFRRHELLTVRMELAAALHHSAQRVEVTREVEEQVLHAGPRAQKTPPPGMRPASLAEPQGPQERILQRTVEQFVDLAPMVQILDAPVPEVVEQLADVLVRVDELVKKQEEEEMAPHANESAHSPPAKEGLRTHLQAKKEEEEEEEDS